MTGFDFLFALFSLLLGLAMAEVLGGFSRALKLHARARAGQGRDVRVGKLVPLMAVYVLLGQLSGWTIMFQARNGVPFTYVALVAVTVVIGGYYLLASLVWPDEPGEWPDFDAYYDQHSRFILTGNLLLLIVGVVAGGHYAPPVKQNFFDSAALTWVMVIGVFGSLLLNVAVIFARRRWLNTMLLTMLIVVQLGSSIVMAVAGPKPV